MSESHPTQQNPEARWFGFREVAPAERSAKVRGVFSNVARRYDIMNDLMSGGVHRLWKQVFVRAVRLRAGERVLDVAGGTGDIARRLHAATGGQAQVVVCDVSEPMVSVGRDRAIDRGVPPGLSDGGIAHVVGNAEAVPLPDRSVDAYTIAFGLRNVTHIDNALAEARRVLRPGGRFFCLEFCPVDMPGLRRLYDLYSFQVIPRLGQIVAQDRDSYQYLVESIRQFPEPPALAERMMAAGLSRPRWRSLSAGIVALHSGWRI